MGDLGHLGGIRSVSFRPLMSLLPLVLVTGLLSPVCVRGATITGTAGPDNLEGTPDADTINGKGGADEMSGLGGNDTYIVDNADDVVIEGAGAGTDRIKASVNYALPIYVENLVLLGSALKATGNGLNNRLTGNAENNTLNGRAGADTMVGLDGDDTYVVDSDNDVVVEATSQGTDLVKSMVTHRLRNNVENLTLIGTGSTNGTGNSMANTLAGNDSNNVLNGAGGDDILNGAGGNDRLIGGPGDDRLTGGPGQDGFQFDAPLDESTNVDRVTDFNPADDTIRLEGSVFTAFSTSGAIGTAAFALGGAATDSSNRILYNQATGALRYDPDGTGPSAAVRFATLPPNLAVTNADFVVINPVIVPVDYATQIQPIFTAHCAICHGNTNPDEGLSLTSQNSYSDLVNVASSEVPSLKRVQPCDPDNSYLVQKIEGSAAVGTRMPRGAPPLSDSDIGLIRQWIVDGAFESSQSLTRAALIVCDGLSP